CWTACIPTSGRTPTSRVSARCCRPASTASATTPVFPLCFRVRKRNNRESSAPRGRGRIRLFPSQPRASTRQPIRAIARIRKGGRLQVMQTPSNDTELSVGRVIQILKKRRWHLIITAVVVTASAVIYAMSQREQYRSEALLTAEAPVPNYVKGELPGPETNIQDKLWLIRENLLIPPVLETVMQEYRL